MWFPASPSTSATPAWASGSTSMLSQILQACLAMQAATLFPDQERFLSICQCRRTCSSERCRPWSSGSQPRMFSTWSITRRSIPRCSRRRSDRSWLPGRCAESRSRRGTGSEGMKFEISNLKFKIAARAPLAPALLPLLPSFTRLFRHRQDCLFHTIIALRNIVVRSSGYGAVLLAMLLISSLAGQQSQTPAPAPASQTQDRFKFKVESQLVLVNVVARDKQGKPVTDLKRDDFTILEDGKPQRIASFDFENLDSTPLAAGSVPAQVSVDGKPAASSKPILFRKDAEEALSNRRVIVLFFDLSSMGPDETQRAVDAARKYVQNKMTVADMIAIVSLAASLRLDQDFTDDRARLLRVLNRFSRVEGQGMDSGPTGDADGIEETGA